MLTVVNLHRVVQMPSVTTVSVIACPSSMVIRIPVAVRNVCLTLIVRAIRPVCATNALIHARALAARMPFAMSLITYPCAGAPMVQLAAPLYVARPFRVRRCGELFLPFLLIFDIRLQKMLSPPILASRRPVVQTLSAAKSTSKLCAPVCQATLVPHPPVGPNVPLMPNARLPKRVSISFVETHVLVLAGWAPTVLLSITVPSALVLPASLAIPSYVVNPKVRAFSKKSLKNTSIISHS